MQLLTVNDDQSSINHRSSKLHPVLIILLPVLISAEEADGLIIVLCTDIFPSAYMYQSRHFRAMSLGGTLARAQFSLGR